MIKVGKTLAVFIGVGFVVLQVWAYILPVLPNTIVFDVVDANVADFFASAAGWKNGFAIAFWGRSFVVSPESLTRATTIIAYIEA